VFQDELKKKITSEKQQEEQQPGLLFNKNGLKISPSSTSIPFIDILDNEFFVISYLDAQYQPSSFVPAVALTLNVSALISATIDARTSILSLSILDGTNDLTVQVVDNVVLDPIIQTLSVVLNPILVQDVNDMLASTVNKFISQGDVKTFALEKVAEYYAPMLNMTVPAALDVVKSVIPDLTLSGSIVNDGFVITLSLAQPFSDDLMKELKKLVSQY